VVQNYFPSQARLPIYFASEYQCRAKLRMQLFCLSKSKSSAAMVGRLFEHLRVQEKTDDYGNLLEILSR